ncbi:hypothetical protein ABW20_dc0106667 [Dactylellina cionopaga]|nr:hypothetical protein ABW20_dc0106667 [Dactylellina cionopaga]
MSKKRKAPEADDTPTFISQANAPPPKENDRKNRKKSASKKSAKPSIPTSHDTETKTHEETPKEKADIASMNTYELKYKPEGEKKEDKYARQKELRKRKKEEKEKFEKYKADVEGKEYVPSDIKKQEKKEKKKAEKLAKKGQPGLSKAEKKQLAEERKEKKRQIRKEAKRAEKAERKEKEKEKEKAATTTNGDSEGTTMKVTITTVEEEKEPGGSVFEKTVIRDVVTIEREVEDKMDVDSDSSADSDSSESESEEKPAAKRVKTNGSSNLVINGKKSKKMEESDSDLNSSDSSDSVTITASTAKLPPSSGTTISSYMTTHAIKITDPKAPDTSSFDLILDFGKLPAVDKSHLAPFSEYTIPTPIQATSWNYLLAGRDLIGVAETGSGKTVAFAYPAVQYLVKLPKSDRNPKKTGAKVVVVSPTRELAMQIYEQFEKLTTAAGLKDAATCIYGGVPKDPQRESLKKALVIVATPGRLNDFLEEGSANISQAEYVVLDEADRMLDKGFEDAIKTILGATPPTPKRQTLMFTATWPQSVRQLASTFMTKPVRIGINSPDDGDLRANTRIAQTVEVLSDGRIKESRLLNLITAHQRSATGSKDDRILVFALYKKEAARLENFLRGKGVKVGGIHGDLNQHTRTTTLAEFKAGRTPVLVATDVAARGLDIPNVKLVINVTFPLTIEDYVHRIGRTGRAGESGKAITFFTEHDKAHSGSLINVLKAASQPVPEELMKFGTTVKKKEHASYGAFYRDTSDAKQATKIKFDE